VRIRTLLGSIAASVGVLVIGWQAGTTVIGTTATTATSSGTQASDSTSSSGTATTDGTTTATATPTPVTATYTGTAVNTRFGSVQVQVTVTDGTITDVTALKLTDTDRKSVEISNRAAPILREEVLAAQSASVSNVSGATYTARAYLTSVQSALDQAGL
jgi:uncharacterized protein with FMN-binding domain